MDYAASPDSSSNPLHSPMKGPSVSFVNDKAKRRSVPTGGGGSRTYLALTASVLEAAQMQQPRQHSTNGMRTHTHHMHVLQPKTSPNTKPCIPKHTASTSHQLLSTFLAKPKD